MKTLAAPNHPKYESNDSEIPCLYFWIQYVGRDYPLPKYYIKLSIKLLSKNQLLAYIEVLC
jgi:hypothetical protein